MNFTLRSRIWKRDSACSHRASAIVVVLLTLILITSLVIALHSLVRFERLSSHLSLNLARANVYADLAADVAMVRINEATSLGMAAGNMWISEPGRIRVYQRSDLKKYQDVDLFSARPTAANNVDLNRPSSSNNYPIAPPAAGASGATMKVGWINLLADPSLPASKDNRLVARIAYWVDDESCKVNINVADGSKKRDLYRDLNSSETSASYGFGVPSEISLEVLPIMTSGLQRLHDMPTGNALASDIAAYAWDKGFNSAEEINRISGLPEDFFEVNRFNLTYYSKSPELTFFGEPRIYLMPGLLVNQRPYTPLIGAEQAQLSLPNSMKDFEAAFSESIDFVYPTSAQLPGGLPTQKYTYKSDVLSPGTLPQYPLDKADQRHNSPTTGPASNNSPNWPLSIRMAQALDGTDSRGGAIGWPAFGTGTPATKYNVRQRDSIVLSILDLANTSVFADHFRGFSLPTISTGILGNELSPNARVELAIGVGRVPSLTEIYVEALTSLSNPFKTGDTGAAATTTYYSIQPQFQFEFYFPETYAGVPLGDPYASGDVADWKCGNESKMTGASSRAVVLNEQDIGVDCPSSTGGSPGDPSPVNPSTYWGDTLLRIAGVDITGNGENNSDPDQTAAALHHHNLPQNAGGLYVGSQTRSPTRRNLPFSLYGPLKVENSPWHPGIYRTQDSTQNGLVALPGDQARAAAGGDYEVRGGFAFRSSTASGTHYLNWELAPLEALRGRRYTDQDPAVIRPLLTEAVIPINFDVPVIGSNDYVAYVADPLVNKFPGDWTTSSSPPATELTFLAASASSTRESVYSKLGAGSINPDFPSTYGENPPTAFNGDNPSFRPSGGGDPLSLWLPRQDVRYPKQSRFPSVGALNYVRTGVIPDDLSVALSNQKGTPWRSLNLSNQAASQGVYPDWALLDLFTVPFLPQSVDTTGTTANLNTRKLTRGGATEGKLNLNNPRVPYPFNLDAAINTSPPERTAPLEALFYGYRVSNSYTDSGTPVFQQIDQSTAMSLSAAVQSFLDQDNQRFLLPGQLAEIAAINDYTYDGVAGVARSRNDLMRQVVGAATTQSNVYSVWVVAQTIQKAPGNLDHGAFEEGDSVTSEVRRRYLIERHLDYGSDNVPGNSVDPGPDGIVGTEDDPLDADVHPPLTYPLPYRWRIVRAENISN